MASFSWPTVQDALIDAVKAAIPSATCVWALQGNTPPLPPKPCAVLNITVRDMQAGLRGSDEVQPTATAGQIAVHAHRRHVVTVTVYSNATHGANHAAALLSGLSRELRKESRTLALRTAGCKVWPTSDVQDVSALLDTRGESRANCDLTVATLDSATETVGWIETVDLTGIDAT